MAFSPARTEKIMRFFFHFEFLPQDIPFSGILTILELNCTWQSVYTFVRFSVFFSLNRRGRAVGRRVHIFRIMIIMLLRRFFVYFEFLSQDIPFCGILNIFELNCTWQSVCTFVRFLVFFSLSRRRRAVGRTVCQLKFESKLVRLADG